MAEQQQSCGACKFIQRGVLHFDNGAKLHNAQICTAPVPIVFRQVAYIYQDEPNGCPCFEPKETNK